MTLTQDPAPVAHWSIGGAFLEALAGRDFDRLAATLSPSVAFRALLPRGPMSWQGSTATTEAFRGWFRSAEEFELVDAAVGEIGGRLHLSWRIRVSPAPFDTGQGWHVLEQQVFADTAGESIEALDLLCSGFRRETHRH